MKIMITGATGRIGRNLARQLQEKHQLILLGNANVPAAGYIQLDLLDTDKVRQTVEQHRPEAIIHLAGLTAQPSSARPKAARRLNVDATASLAEAAIACGTRTFVFASSSAVYNQTKLEPTDEEHNVEPQTLYGRTKLEAEQVLKKLSGRGPTKFIALRLFNIYGPEFDDSLVYRLLHSSKNAPVMLYGPDNFYRDYIHVWDVVTAFEACLSLGQKFGVLNIGSGQATSNRQLVEVLEGQGAKIYFSVKKSPRSISWADITRSAQTLGWKPVKTLAQSIGEISDAR